MSHKIFFAQGAGQIKPGDFEFCAVFLRVNLVEGVDAELLEVLVLLVPRKEVDLLFLVVVEEAEEIVVADVHAHLGLVLKVAREEHKVRQLGAKLVC